jgi:hypothetical protein
MARSNGPVRFERNRLDCVPARVVTAVDPLRRAGEAVGTHGKADGAGRTVLRSGDQALGDAA